MEKSHESFMINDNFGDHVIYLLMVFAGVFGSTFYWQSNLDWSISDAILSTFTFGIGAFLIRLMLNIILLESLQRRLFLIFGRKDLLAYQKSNGQFAATLKIPQLK